jgi:type I restriction enzyme S subunit
MSSEPVLLRNIIEVNPKIEIVKGKSYPFMDMAAITEWQRDVPLKSLTSREYKGSGSKFQSGDILLARITPCFENGKAAVVPAMPTVGHGSTEFIVVRAKDPDDRAFIYALMRCEDFRDHAIKSMVGSSGRQRIPNSALDTYSTALPDQDYRTRASKLLHSMENLCSILKTQNEAFESLAQTLFRSWFVTFDPVHAKAAGTAPEAMSAELAALFPSEFEGSELGSIPKGWAAESLDKRIDYLNGLALQKFPPIEGEATLPVIKISQLKAGRGDPAVLANRRMKPAFIVKDGDIIFSWSGSLALRIWTGGEGALNQHLFKVSSTSLPHWFCFQATLLHLTSFQETAASKATTMGHIQRHHLTEAKVAAPPDALLKKMSDVFKPLFESIVTNGQLIRALEQLRDHILPRLISGKLCIEDAEASLAELTSGLETEPA